MTSIAILLVLLAVLVAIVLSNTSSEASSEDQEIFDPIRARHDNVHARQWGQINSPSDDHHQ